MTDPQQQTYVLYTSLMALRPAWGGQLVLATGLDAIGQALAFATIAAGGACLTIEADTDLCRAATRSGAVDFLVNTVDEALRVLKNEIRKHTPLSVALQATPDAALAELEQRGVYPALFSGPQSYPAIARLSENTQPPPMVLTFATLVEQRAAEERLRQILPAEDPRQRWISAASRLFHRDRRRVITLTEAEHAQLA